MEQTPTTSVTSKAEKRREAFNALIAELNVCRKVAITPDRLGGMLKMLNKDEYTYEQMQRARLWILYGDWTRKGFDPTLELSDFYPTDEQFKESKAKLKSEGVLIFTRDQYKRESERLRGEGYAEGLDRKHLERVTQGDLQHGQPLRTNIEVAIDTLFGGKQVVR